MCSIVGMDLDRLFLPGENDDFNGAGANFLQFYDLD